MGAQLEGGKELERALAQLGPRVARKWLRRAVNVGATPVLQSAREKSPRESGLLAKSLDKKIKTYASSMTAVAIIGPRTDVAGEFEGAMRVPWRYAHLVEDGHIDASGASVRAQPFMRPAFDQNRAGALSAISAKLAEGVKKEASGK